MGRVRAVVHRVQRLSNRFHTTHCYAACPVRVMRAIGFCHLLLQSRALVSRSFSTRSLPHARGLFRFPRSLPVPFFRRTEHSSTQRFHAAVVTVVDDRVVSVFLVPRFPQAIIEPLSCL